MAMALLGRIGLFVAGLAILFGAGSAGATAPYTAVDLGTCLGGSSSSAAAINDAGIIAGSSRDDSGHQWACLWTETGAIGGLGTLGGSSSSATDINNLGQVVGSSTVSSGVSHAFLWTPGRGMVDLGTSGGISSGAAKINDAGEVVGSWTDASYHSHAFLWTPADGMIDLGIPDGGIGSNATGVNDAGEVVGSWMDSSYGPHAFVWTRAGGMADFDLGTETRPRAVNDAGQIGGDFIVPTPTGGTTFHGFLWTPGAGAVDVGKIGLSYSYGFDLNEAGQLVGRFRVAAPGVVEHAFSWTQAGGAVDLGTLGGIGSTAAGVNSSGEVVGTANTADGASHATLWHLPDVTPPAAPPAPDLSAVSDSGTSDADNVTMRWHLFVQGTAESGSTVTLYRDGVTAGTARADLLGKWIVLDSVAADGVYGYTATATDAAGNTSPASAALIVTVDSHLPVLTVGGLTADATRPDGAVVGYSASATDAFDPNPAVLCSPDAGSLFPIGDTTLRCTATDLAGNPASASFTVHVRGAGEQASVLAELVLATNANQGIVNSLDAKLGAVRQALAATESGDRAEASNQLGAFSNEVNAQAGKTLTAGQALQLVTAAGQIRAVLGY